MISGGALDKTGTSPLGGIMLFLLALVFAAAASAIAKLLAQEHVALLIVWGRYAIGALIFSFVAVPRHRQTLCHLDRPFLQIFRGLLLTASSAFFIFAIARIPLASALAILFVYPFFITVAARFVLGEHVQRKIWIAVVSGFLGVITVIGSGFGPVSGYAIFAALSGVFYGSHLLVTRALALTTPPVVTGLCTSFIGAMVLSPAALLYWNTVAYKDAILLAIMALLATSNQILTIIACKRTDISTLAPFGYSELVAATILGYVVFSEFPSNGTWLGMAIIVLSGVYIANTAKGHRLPLLSRSRPPAT